MHQASIIKLIADSHRARSKCWSWEIRDKRIQITNKVL